MMTTILTVDDLQLFDRVLVRVAPREYYGTQPLRPEVRALTGRTGWLVYHGRMGDGEQYPGEGRLVSPDLTPDDHLPSALSGTDLPWIASGDVEILDIGQR